MDAYDDRAMIAAIFIMLVLCANAMAEPLQLGLHPSGALGTKLDLYDNLASPAGPIPIQRNTVECRGDNTTFTGCMGAYFQARDRSDVSSANKGVLYGLGVSVVPLIERDNVPFDDVAAISVINDGTAKGTEGIYVGRGSRVAGSEWIDAFGSDANADWGVRLGGRLELAAVTTRHADIVSNVGIELKNNHSVSGLDAAQTTWTNLIKLTSNDTIEIGAPGRVNRLPGFSQFGLQPAENNGIISGRQFMPGADTLFFQRASDADPTGSLLRFTDAANTRNLWRVNADGSMSMAVVAGPVQGGEWEVGVLRFEAGSAAGSLKLVAYGPSGSRTVIADEIR